MIFITGATGFLGSHLLHELALLDEPVRALYRDREKLDLVRKIFRYYPGDTDTLMEKIHWVQGDLSDYQALTEYLKDVDKIYHCAGMVSFNNADKQKMIDINIQGTANVVNACLELNISRFCHVSSISALGASQDGESIDEKGIWSQDSSASHYSFTKFRGEMEVWRGIHEGLHAVIINPSVIIGPGMWHGSASGLYQQILKGLKYYPAGTTGFVDVRDVAAIMIRLTNSNITAERFTISAENKTHREILNYLAEGLGRPLPNRPITPALARIICSLEKVRSIITGKPLRVTMRSFQSASSYQTYTNKKIRETLSIDFIPVRESMAFSLILFKAENKVLI